ncbi:extracellular solute-binding protein [Anaerocolumna sedimenticola]|uniref:Extracellular solute-binding protein n=1 Tax=Anaerocolumna sedimenticola TaxID=2696063 RepID=A0A6P1TGK4_9FIRM|nr:extracellular solute-binding protein [Anaerocolumna sedimenticola]QHQ59553.1 extracellular solute-binding protein [Anaerocolumna sedimenticola]
MKKKLLSILLCAVLAASVLTGCRSSEKTSGTNDQTNETAKEVSGAESSDTSDKNESDTPASDASGNEGTEGKNTFIEGATDLSLWTFVDQHVGFYTGMADKWNEANPDKAINLTVNVADSSSMHTKLLVALQSGTGAPDIADIEIGHYATFLGSNYLLPLNDVVEPYKDEVVMSRISMYGDKDGNYYGIDFHLGASVSYYNMDLMKEAGVDPAEIKTWDDYYNAGLKVLEVTGKPMTAVEVTDLFLPQLMLEEKGVQYVTEDGTPNINTKEHAEVINFIRKMIDAGICEVTPGGFYHAEEWYGHLNSGEVASISMPLWYMGRFTDYCPDLKGKIGIYKLPVWKEGDTPCVLQGGTGTGVTTQSKNSDLAKEFLAFAKLSEDGNKYEWENLGFDPIRVSLWSDESLTKNQDNKFISYFATNPFDVLNSIKDTYGLDLVAPNIAGGYAQTYSVLVTTTYANAFESAYDQDASELLKNEQETILYEK